MSQWEYMFVNPSAYREGDLLPDFDKWMSYINGLGDEGWELIGEVRLAKPDGKIATVLLAKRETSSIFR